MNQDEIKKIIVESLREIAPDTEPAALSPDDIIREKLGIDSFDFLQFIVSLDEKFGIDIPEIEYGNISTLAHLTAYLTKQIEQKSNTTTS